MHGTPQSVHFWFSCVSRQLLWNILRPGRNWRISHSRTIKVNIPGPLICTMHYRDCSSRESPGYSGKKKKKKLDESVFSFGSTRAKSKFRSHSKTQITSGRDGERKTSQRSSRTPQESGWRKYQLCMWCDLFMLLEQWFLISSSAFPFSSQLNAFDLTLQARIMAEFEEAYILGRTRSNVMSWCVAFIQLWIPFYVLNNHYNVKYVYTM